MTRKNNSLFHHHRAFLSKQLNPHHRPNLNKIYISLTYHTHIHTYTQKRTAPRTCNQTLQPTIIIIDSRSHDSRFSLSLSLYITSRNPRTHWPVKATPNRCCTLPPHHREIQRSPDRRCCVSLSFSPLSLSFLPLLHTMPHQQRYMHNERGQEMLVNARGGCPSDTGKLRVYFHTLSRG